MMIKLKLIFSGILLISTVSSCRLSCDVKDISVSELLLESAVDKGIDYCDVVTKASLNDDDAIKQISVMDFDNAVGYDHGAVLVDLILKIGEQKYIEIITAFTKEDKNRIKGYLRVGLEYGGNPQVKSKSIDEAFPKLYIFLNE